MKKRTALVILLVISLLSLTFLSGCGTDASEEPAVEEEVTAPESEQEEAEEPAQEEAEEPAEETAEEEMEKLQVALILSTSPADQTWGYNAHQAFQNVAEKLDFVEIAGVDENVSETDAESFMMEYGRDGVDVVINNSFGFWESAQRATEAFPDMVAVFPGGDESLTTENVGTYYPNTYEATYLVGMTAGLMTESDQIGYVLSVALPPLMAETNAYIEGAKAVNPDVEVSVIETGDFTIDATRESEATQTLIDQGIDFLGFQLNGLAALDTAADAGIFVSTPFVSQQDLAPDSWVTCSRWNWEPYYEWLFTSVYEGTWESSAEYWGLQRGMADICEFSDLVPEEVQEQVMVKKQEILDGSFEVPYLIEERLWETE
jgi:basic membrane lipoprotein Med (substrate-binding protein (PBP1-ABC) superfamily)